MLYFCQQDPVIQPNLLPGNAPSAHTQIQTASAWFIAECYVCFSWFTARKDVCWLHAGTAHRSLWMSPLQSAGIGLSRWTVISCVNAVLWFHSGDSDSIKVFVRVRPLTQGTGLTTDGDQSLCLTVTSPNTIRLLSKPEPRTFTYDHVANMDTSQVWREQPLIWSHTAPPKIEE